MRIMLFIFVSTFSSNVFSSGLETLKEYAENGDIGAMNTLGFVYITGKNTPRNQTEALKWFEKAAIQGEYQSMNSLAIMYQTGDGVAVDLAKAWAWYSLAALFIQKNVFERNIPQSKIDTYQRTPEKIALQLTKNELSKAQDLQIRLIKEIDINQSKRALNMPESLGIKYSCPFVSEIEFRVFHILFANEQDAQDTYSTIKNDKNRDKFIPFKLAAPKSLDNGTKDIDGDLGYVKANYFLDFMDVILTSKLNELSAPTKSEYGWHLVWIEDARDGVSGTSCNRWPNAQN